MEDNKNNYFCAKASRQAQEKIFGTGGIGDIWLLLEYPKPWGNKAIAESDLPEEVKNHLGSFSKESVKIKTLLIKQDVKVKTTFDLFIVYIDELSPKIYKIILQDYRELLKLNTQNLITAQTPLRSSLEKSPLFLVCTHGKHDKCCAKYGFTTYKYMRDIANENVWQSSHVGGDRFASNVVCFPHGIFYGHVSNEDANVIIDSYNKENIYLKNYRGRVCYSRYGQIAEYFVRKESNITNLNHLILQEITELEPNLWQSVFYSETKKTIFRLSFSSLKSNFLNYLTCHASEPKPVNQYRLESFNSEYVN